MKAIRRHSAFMAHMVVRAKHAEDKAARLSRELAEARATIQRLEAELSRRNEQDIEQAVN